MALETSKYDVIYGRLLSLDFRIEEAKQLAKFLYDVSEELNLTHDQVLAYVTANGIKFDNKIYERLNKKRTNSSQVGFIDQNLLPIYVKSQLPVASSAWGEAPALPGELPIPTVRPIIPELPETTLPPTPSPSPTLTLYPTTTPPYTTTVPTTTATPTTTTPPSTTTVPTTTLTPTLTPTSTQTGTFQLSASTSQQTEGYEIVFTLSDTGLPVGSQVAYQIIGVSAADLYPATLTGNFVINSSGSATVTYSPISDSLVEGTETMTLVINSPVFRQASVNIIDQPVSSSWSLEPLSTSTIVGTDTIMDIYWDSGVVPGVQTASWTLSVTTLDAPFNPSRKNIVVQPASGTITVPAGTQRGHAVVRVYSILPGSARITLTGSDGKTAVTTFVISPDVWY